MFDKKVASGIYVDLMSVFTEPKSLQNPEVPLIHKNKKMSSADLYDLKTVKVGPI